MLPAGPTDKLLQWDLEILPPRKPGAVDSIAGSIDTAVPDAFEAKQNIALQLRPDLLQLISKPDYGRRPHTLYRSKWPVVLGPFIRRHKLDLFAGFDDSFRKSFQVRLSTTAPRITAANESDFELFCHSKRSRGIRRQSTFRSFHRTPRLCFASLGMTTLHAPRSPEYL